MLNKNDRSKNCFINLERLSQKDYELYSHSSEIIVKNFSLGISGDLVQYEGLNHYSKSHIFNFQLKKHLSDIVLECCDPVKKEDSAQEQIQVGKSLTALINQSWRKCKNDSKPSGHPSLNSIVMAKMATYCPWPARVEGFTKNNKRAYVFFFGTNNVGSVLVNEMVNFTECHSIIRLLLLRKLCPFHKGIVEVEAIQGVPPELSLTRERFAMKN